MILIQRSLEWRASSTTRGSRRLHLDLTAAHEPITLVFLVLLAAPDTPCHDKQACKDDSAANADDDADDGFLGRRRHARGFGGRGSVERGVVGGSAG